MVEEYVSIASRRGKQRKFRSCGSRAASLGHRHDANDRFARHAPPAQSSNCGCDFDCIRPALGRTGVFRADALQWRGDDMHCEMQKEPRPVVDIDLPDQLRATPVGLQEDWLLGQRPTTILRASQAIIAKRFSRQFQRSATPARRAGAKYRPLRIPNPTSRTL